MNSQITDMCVRTAVEESRKTRNEFGKLSDEQLERIIENHIPNPISRTYTRFCVGGTASLWGRNEDGSYSLHDEYVPTKGEYEIATKLLEERRK